MPEQFEFEGAELGDVGVAVDKEGNERPSIAKGQTINPRHLNAIQKLIAAGVNEKGYGLRKLSVIVTTGPMDRSGTRGILEKADGVQFQRAANNLGYGLRVVPEHLPNDKTRLDMHIQPKRPRPEAAIATLRKTNGMTAPTQAPVKQAAPKAPAGQAAAS